MESQKNNMWMISTFVLLGVVIGFGVAQFSGGGGLFTKKPVNSAIGAFSNYAKELDLNKKDFATCLNEGKFADKVDADLQDGVKFGVTGTPGFFVNGRPIDGAQPYEVFQVMFDSLLVSSDESVSGEAGGQAGKEASGDEENTKLSEEEYLSISKEVEKGGISEGESNAPIVMVEFSDFQCPYCERFFTQTLPLIRTNYIETGKVRLVYRHFPLSFHPHAHLAAEASECANEQGKFKEMHDMIFEKQAEWAVFSKTTDK